VITLLEVDRAIRKSRQWQDAEHDVDGGHLAAQTIPVGATMGYLGTTAPAGWLWLNGATISRLQYAELFKVIGAQGGAGNTTTTFTLPAAGNTIIFTGVA
jgi:hypothetical protein